MKRLLIAFALIVTGSLTHALLFSSATPTSAACNDGRILTFKPWYHGLQDNNDCSNIVSPKADRESQIKFVWRIILNIIEDLLQVVGYVAVGYIMYGGFLYMTTAATSSEGALKARRTITNALIGLGVALASIAIVNMAVRAMGI